MSGRSRLFHNIGLGSQKRNRVSNAQRIIQDINRIRYNHSIANFNNYSNFFEHEFACKCGCGISETSKILLDLLQIARLIYGKKMFINSGCRCKSHNARVGGNPNSHHITERNNPCKAVDIRFNDTNEAIEMVRALLFAGFKRIGINWRLSFIHADVGNGQALFSY